MTFSLSAVSTKHLQILGQCIWNWELCGTCYGHPECTQATCSWSSSKRLKTFWNRYTDITSAYAPEFSVAGPALSSHEDLIKIIQAIKDHPNLKRAELTGQIFPTRGQDATSPTIISDQNRAVNIAASVLFLTNCGTLYECADFFEDEGSSLPWRDGMTAYAFASEAYPIKVHPYFEHTSDEYKAEAVIKAVLGTRLIKAGLILEPTNDLRSHLTVEYNKRKKVIKVFHCTAVLREMLLASQKDPTASLIPRLVALEVLESIHHVLFPSDRKSQDLLSSLVQKSGFDKDLLLYDMARYRRHDDPDITYSYLGTRLADIYDELQDPTPRPGLESWFQKYSAQRYMLMATTIGVFIAVILGFLGLIVNGLQAWIAYQQWKHPVKNV